MIMRHGHSVLPLECDRPGLNDRAVAACHCRRPHRLSDPAQGNPSKITIRPLFCDRPEPVTVIRFGVDVFGVYIPVDIRHGNAVEPSLQPADTRRTDGIGTARSGHQRSHNVPKQTCQGDLLRHGGGRIDDRQYVVICRRRQGGQFADFLVSHWLSSPFFRYCERPGD